MAFQAQAQRGQQRPLFVHVAEGYHGDTLGAVSVGGIDLFHSTYRPILLETRMVSSPGVLAPGQTRADRAGEVLAELRALLERDGDQVCAVVIEPLVQAAGGMLTHDVSFVRRRARPVRRVRRADGGRRGGDRHRPHRAHVGGRARRRRARPADLRQGSDRRLPAAVGGARARGGLRRVPRRTGRGAHVLPRPLLHRQPALLRRGHREPPTDGRTRDGRRTRRASASASAS